MKFLDIIESAKSVSALIETKTEESTALLQSQVNALLDRIRELPPDHDPQERAQMLLDTARNLILLEEGAQAWAPAREAFDIYVAAQNWEKAVECCDALYLSGHSDALIALGQGVWLAVTFPVNPELSVALLEHVVDDTPDDSDGAAVAAITAHYVADVRSNTDQQRENLTFFTGQLLAKVARRHSEIDSQAKFDWWLNKLELNDPALFLPRLRNVVDVLVQDQWWIDRDAIRASLPVN
ncbi:MAG: hypothetical protein ACYDC8_03445 [Gammaproteobacteria bacterium]